MILSKKAAMFGLDARIALVIFGALSVISGASLYSAIQESRVTALITEMNELTKAYEAYYLDTGSHLKGAALGQIETDGLLTNPGLAGWAGPYTSHERLLITRLEFNPYESAHFSSFTDAAFGDAVNATTCGSPCYVWIGAYEVPTAIREAVDERIDITRDNQNGKVRLHDYKNAIFWNTGIIYN